MRLGGAFDARIGGFGKRRFGFGGNFLLGFGLEEENLNDLCLGIWRGNRGRFWLLNLFFQHFFFFYVLLPFLSST
jgi:hypothetical protein